MQPQDRELLQLVQVKLEIFMVSWTFLHASVEAFSGLQYTL